MYLSRIHKTVQFEFQFSFLIKFRIVIVYQGNVTLVAVVDLPWLLGMIWLNERSVGTYFTFQKVL